MTWCCQANIAGQTTLCSNGGASTTRLDPVRPTSVWDTAAILMGPVSRGGKSLVANERERVNVFLAAPGLVLLVIAAVGLFSGKNVGLSGGFLIAGVFLCIGAAMAPRMEGEQTLGLTGAKFTLGKLPPGIEEAEQEVTTKRLPEIEDIL